MSFIELLEAARGGSRGALGELLESFRGRLLAFAGRLARRCGLEPADLVQEAFLAATLHFAEFHDVHDEEMFRWLSHILLNKVRDGSRRVRACKRDMGRELPLQSPGDILVMSAAVRDLHLAHPGQFQTDVRTAADAIWEHNPNITRLSETEPRVEIIDMHYPLIHQSNQRPYHFIHGYVQFLEDKLQVRIPVTRFQGEIHLSAEEKELPLDRFAAELREDFWIMMAGGKYDFTAKWWDPACFQKVVDHFQGKIQFAQCGEQGHWHPRLKGVVDLIGKTSTRDFIRLMYHAAGVVCPVTFAMHLAAVETHPGRPRCRPCIVIAGGREPAHWEAYPGHQFLHTIGALPCCAEGGCWRSRCQLVGDGNPKDRREVCEQPVQVADDLRIPRCMHMITAEEVIRRIELYVYPPQKTEQHVGRIVYPARLAPTDGLTIRPTAPPTAPVAAFAKNAGGPPTPLSARTRLQKIHQKVFIRFRHGLGDAVQLTIVLKHLRHYHPDWLVDVAALPGRPSVFHGLCHQARLLDQDRFDRFQYHQTIDLDWPECETGYPDCPSTKASRCLVEVFQLKPLPELCRYSIEAGEQAREHTARYLAAIWRGDRRDDGRFPAVLIHYQGTTSAEYKDLPHDLASRLCDIILDAGCVPIILDWHRRSPLIGRAGVHNPGPGHALWHGADTADADVLAALIEQSALMIGVDSGPLHVAGATTTPTLGVWTRHHPVHSFDLADNVLHLVPADHDKHLRGSAAADFFRQNYRFRTYETLGSELPTRSPENYCTNSAIDCPRTTPKALHSAAQGCMDVTLGRRARLRTQR